MSDNLQIRWRECRDTSEYQLVEGRKIVSRHGSFSEAVAALNAATGAAPLKRRHKLPPGECAGCDRQTGDFHPSHDASHRCESGKRPHCTCDTCF